MTSRLLVLRRQQARRRQPQRRQQQGHRRRLVVGQPGVRWTRTLSLPVPRPDLRLPIVKPMATQMWKILPASPPVRILIQPLRF